MGKKKERCEKQKWYREELNKLLPSNVLTRAEKILQGIVFKLRFGFGVKISISVTFRYEFEVRCG